MLGSKLPSFPYSGRWSSTLSIVGFTYPIVGFVYPIQGLRSDDHYPYSEWLLTLAHMKIYEVFKQPGFDHVTTRLFVNCYFLVPVNGIFAQWSTSAPCANEFFDHFFMLHFSARVNTCGPMLFWGIPKIFFEGRLSWLKPIDNRSWIEGEWDDSVPTDMTQPWCQN